MKRIGLFVISLAAATLLAACGAPVSNTGTNISNASNTNTGKTVAAAPTKEALMTLERSAYEAWKTKDAKFWDTFLAANFVGFGQGVKLDKASATKQYTGADCEIKSYTLSDEQMKPLGNDAALITYKTTIDGTCGGKKVPAATWATGVYVREGNAWKGAFHAEAPVIDPKAPPVQAAAPMKKDDPAAKPMETKSDPSTDALMAIEKKAWEDWKDKNAKGLDEFAAKEMVSLSAAEGWTDRAASLKRWAEPCEIKSVSITDPASVAFGTEYALLTFKSAVDGKCGDQTVPSELGATVYAKEGGVWKALMTMGSPISQ